MRKDILIQDKKFKKYISSQKIRKAIAGIAKRINKDFAGTRPIFLSLLNGSFMFTADLFKKLNIECEVSFVKLASYAGIQSTGKTNILIGLNGSLKGRVVIVLEDIVDSGVTIEKLMTELKKHNAKQVKIATMFFKPHAYQKKIKLDYVGLNVPNDFIVGYGLDYNGLGRNLSDIYIYKP